MHSERCRQRPGTTINYLRGAAGNSLGTTIKYLRRTTSSAADFGLGSTIKCLCGAVAWAP
jgi:hypothetical protein